MALRGKSPKKEAAKDTLPRRKLSKTPRDLSATRARILAAAAREFALKGLEGARIDRIAVNSRANKAMIYYIFRSKESLHLAVLENLFEEKTRNLDAETISGSPLLPDLLSMLSSYLDAFLNNPDATRMILHDLAAGASALRQLKKRRPELIRPFREISGRLQDLMSSGKIQSLDPDKAVLTVMLLLMALAVFLPHADILYPRGKARHQALTDLDSWKSFLSEVLLKNLV